MSGVEVSVCRRCGWSGFPARLWCPSCLSESVEVAWMDHGVVEDVSTMRRATGRELQAPVRLGTVRFAEGGRLVARLEAAIVGERVHLSTDAGAPVASPAD